MITGASSIESIKFGSISTISPVSSKIRGILLLVVATLSAVRLEGPGRTLTYNKESKKRFVAVKVGLQAMLTKYIDLTKIFKRLKNIEKSATK